MYARPTGFALLVVVTAAASVAARPIPRPPQAADETAVATTAPSLSEAEIARLTTALDTSLAAPRDPADWPGAAKTAVWTFVERLQAAQLTPAQEAETLRHLDEIGRAHPALIGVISQACQTVRTQTVGKTAPEITGRDLDGIEFKLSDYRGKVVVLAFTGDWCGICRSEYPYERFLVDLYRNWPFAILGVNSDADRALAHQASVRNGLTYRSWFDGPPGGPIASSWSVVGWPTVYVIDARGVIRFVDLQREDLLKGVRELLIETTRAGAGATGPARTSER